MPVRAQPANDLVVNNQYHSKFRHATESATPGYYTVMVDDWNTTVELTAAGTHAGMHRYSCHGSEPCVLLLDMCHSVQSVLDGTCKNASVTVNVMGDDGTVVIAGNVLHAGDMSSKIM